MGKDNSQLLQDVLRRTQSFDVLICKHRNGWFDPRQRLKAKIQFANFENEIWHSCSFEFQNDILKVPTSEGGVGS